MQRGQKRFVHSKGPKNALCLHQNKRQSAYLGPLEWMDVFRPSYKDVHLKKLVIKSGVYFWFDVFLLILVLPFGSILNGVSLYKQKNNNFTFAVWILNWHGMSLIIISCAVSGFPLLPTIRKSVGREVLESYFSARHKENGLLQQQKNENRGKTSILCK